MQLDTENQKIYYCDPCMEALNNRFLDLSDNYYSVNLVRVPGI